MVIWQTGRSRLVAGLAGTRGKAPPIRESFYPSMSNVPSLLPYARAGAAPASVGLSISTCKNVTLPSVTTERQTCRERCSLCACQPGQDDVHGLDRSATWPHRLATSGRCNSHRASMATRQNLCLRCGLCFYGASPSALVHPPSSSDASRCLSVALTRSTEYLLRTASSSPHAPDPPSTQHCNPTPANNRLH